MEEKQGRRMVFWNIAGVSQYQLDGVKSNFPDTEAMVFTEATNAEAIPPVIEGIGPYALYHARAY